MRRVNPMLKTVNCLAVALVLLAVFTLPVQAITVDQGGVAVASLPTFQTEGVVTEGVWIIRDIKTGAIDCFSYDIASTYSTSDIHYRTTAVTLQFPGIPVEVAVPVKDQLLAYNQALKSSPDFKYGRTYYSQISISRDAILNATPEQYREMVRKALDNPEGIGIIKTGAHIEIYNAKSGKVLALLTKPEDVLKQTIMPQHRSRLLARFQELDLTGDKETVR